MNKRELFTELMEGFRALEQARHGKAALKISSLTRFTDRIKNSVQHYFSSPLMKAVTASDANRDFSRLLREVAEGEVITIVSRGRAVAVMAPVDSSGEERAAAKSRLLERLQSQEITGKRDWARDELYED